MKEVAIFDCKAECKYYQEPMKNCWDFSWAPGTTPVLSLHQYYCYYFILHSLNKGCSCLRGQCMVVTRAHYNHVT